MFLCGVDVGVDGDKCEDEADHPDGNDDEDNNGSGEVLAIALWGTDNLKPSE